MRLNGLSLCTSIVYTSLKLLRCSDDFSLYFSQFCYRSSYERNASQKPGFGKNIIKFDEKKLFFVFGQGMVQSRSFFTAIKSTIHLTALVVPIKSFYSGCQRGDKKGVYHVDNNTAQDHLYDFYIAHDYEELTRKATSETSQVMRPKAVIRD